jgi:hypothetical protein
MSNRSHPAAFGPEDSDGFRTVSFYGREGAEVLRLSLNIECLRHEFTETASDIQQYSSEDLGPQTIRPGVRPAIFAILNLRRDDW